MKNEINFFREVLSWKCNSSIHDINMWFVLHSGDGRTNWNTFVILSMPKTIPWIKYSIKCSGSWIHHHPYEKPSVGILVKLYVIFGIVYLF